MVYYLKDANGYVYTGKNQNPFESELMLAKTYKTESTAKRSKTLLSQKFKKPLFVVER